MLPKGIKPVKKRLASGVVQTYYYHRATGQRLTEEPFSAAWLIEIKALDDKAAAIKAKTTFVADNSFAALWTQYRQASFRHLKPRTQRDYQACRDWLGPNMATIPITEISRGRILRWRDKAVKDRGRRFANYVVTVVRIVMKFALDREVIRFNPATDIEDIPRPTDARAVNRALSMAEVKELLASDLPPQLRLPVTLGLFCALREGDVLKLTLSSIHGGMIHWRAGKNAEPVERALTGTLAIEVAKRLETKAPAIQLCLNSRGRPWTESGFRATFFKHVRKLTAAGRLQPGVTFHGLRHTVGTLARDMGFSDFEIASSIGDRSVAMAMTYGRDASKKAARARVLSAQEEHLMHTQVETVLETTPNVSSEKA